MGFGSGKTLTDLLARIGNANAKGEFYLTDAVALARADGLDTRMSRPTPWCEFWPMEMLMRMVVCAVAGAMAASTRRPPRPRVAAARAHVGR